MFNEKVKFFGPPGHQGERPGKTGRDSEKSGGELKKKQNKKHQLDMKLETVTTGGKAQGRGRRIIVGLQNYVFAYRLDGKAMAPHSSTLAWKIPWTEEPGRL